MKNPVFTLFRTAKAQNLTRLFVCSNDKSNDLDFDERTQWQG